VAGLGGVRRDDAPGQRVVLIGRIHTGGAGTR
jgi:hypothetical protein